MNYEKEKDLNNYICVNGSIILLNILINLGADKLNKALS